MVALFPLILTIGGRWIWSCIGPTFGVRAETPPAGRVLLAEDSFCGLLSGFALSSLGLFLLAHFGRLSLGAVGAGAAIGGAACLFACWRRRLVPVTLAALRQDLVVGVALVGLVVLFGALFRPIDTTLAASDSSVYLATAHQLARSGTILHRDSLVGEMSAKEREVLFVNRFQRDHTGPFARFPGGVLLVSASSDVVSFYFYHLFPVWLAVGLQAAGDESYLQLLAVFATIGLVSLFFVGRRLGGTLMALALCVVHASFQPQAFYSRLPSSELLAQALFLSGLFVYLRGLGSSDGDRRPYVRLAGLLWGASCLCRVDAIPFLWLGLTAVSLLPASFGIRREDWAIPMLSSVLFALLAVYHQLANGIDYFGAFSPGHLATTVSLFVSARTWPNVVVLAVLTVAGLFVYMSDPARLWNGRVLAMARPFGLLVSSITLARFSSVLNWSDVGGHLRWIEMYTTPFVLVVLAVGVLLAVVEAFRARSSPMVAVAVAFFAGPAYCYLIDPMTAGHQPWVVRRFVPVIFPLLFVLALYGWQAGMRRVFRTRPAVGRAAFAVLTLAIAGLFVTAPAGLTIHPARVKTAAKVRAFAGAIPQGALVLIPDDDASLHLQLALEYTGGRDVLLLPLRYAAGKWFEPAMNGFLDRQFERGRRVFLVLTGTMDAAREFASRFELDAWSERVVAFEAVPFVPADALPGPPVRSAVRVRVLEVHRPRGSAGAPPARVGR